MTELYIVFLIVGIVLYLLIVGYSFWQKQQRTKLMSRTKNVEDPLLDKKSSASTSTQSPQKKVASKPSINTSENGNDESDIATDKRLAPSFEEIIKETQEDKPSNIKVKKEGEPSVAVELPVTKNDVNVNLADNKEVIDIKTAIADKERAEIQESTIVKMHTSELETELVTRIKNIRPLEQQELLVLFREYDYKFNRKVHLYGLNELTDLWRDIEHELPSARFVALGISIQLADRNGPISKKELHDFQQMALAFTERFDAPFEFSMDIDEAKGHAAQLAQITERYDSMAVLNIVPRNKTGFRAADIESCARDLMMSMDAQGIFLKSRGQKKNTSVLYRLACPDGAGHFGIKPGSSSPVHDLVIYMNVPATESPELVFQEMFADTKKLATWLDGKVVDRHGKVMTQRSYEALIKQISDIVYNMEGEGIKPGGSLSKKLF